MNKNKKLIALICAIAMILSMFAGFTVVNAEDVTQGIVLEYDAANSTGNKAVIAAKAVGFEQVESYTVNINIPEGATVTAVEKLIGGGAENTKDGVYGYAAATDTAVDLPADGTILKLEINLASGLDEAFTVSLQAKSGISCGSVKLSTVRDNLTITDTTIPEYVDPDATPKPTPIATRAPKPTAKPVGTAGPTKEPVEVEQGITLVYDEANSTETKAVVIAKAVGFEQVESYTVNVNIPDGATVTAATKLIAGGAENTANGVYGYAAATDTAVDVPADGAILVLEINLANALTSDHIMELQAKSGISCGSTKLSTVRDNLPIAWTTIPVFSGETEEPTPTPAVSKPVTLPDVNITTDKIPTNTENLYIAVSVKTKDGSVADYGKDYSVTLTLPNGTTKALTAEEFGYILNGYFDLVPGAESMTWTDVINGLKFHVYSDGVTVSAQLINDGAVISGGDSTVTFTPVKPTPGPKVSVEGKSAGKKTTTVVVGKIITLTATVANVPDGVEGEWSYEMDEKDAEKYLEPYGMTIKDNGDAQLKLEGIATKTSVPVTFKYVNKADETVIAEGTVKVKVTKESTGSGSSGSNDSSDNDGNGIIARPGIQTPNNNGVIAFSDIDTVPWAEDAILALVQRGVINGRDNVTFDPNGTVTRAEFAKMVVLGFGLTGGTVGNFSDVGVGDWYSQYVEIGYANGVISGYDDGTFRPNGLITRQEMAAMISRAIKAAGKTLPATVSAAAFTDVTEADCWGYAEIATLQQGGVINGMTETTYEPQSNATRAQAAVIIYRAITKAL